MSLPRHANIAIIPPTIFNISKVYIMKKLLLIAITASLLTACGKSEKEIELERAKIELQREQIRLEEQKQAEAKVQQEAQQSAPPPVVNIPQPQQQEKNTETAPKRQEFVRHEEGVLVNNAKATMGVNLLRSTQVHYQGNDSILCGEFMDGNTNSFKRFVFVETYNPQEGNWRRSVHQDWTFSPSFTDNLWRVFCN